MADVIVLVRVKLSLFRGSGKDRVRGSVNSRVQWETWESVTRDRKGGTSVQPESRCSGD